MSEMLLPPNAGAPPAPPPDAGANPLVAALGAGPGGSDTAQMPPELMAALGGGSPETPPEPGMEPASLEAALEHFRMGVQMLQELQVASPDDREMHELGGLMSPVTKLLADRAKGQAVAGAGAPVLGGGGGGA